MFKKILFLIIGISSCVILFILYADEFNAYNDGKFYYETVGEYGNTLTDAHRKFILANGFWDSEDYIQKIEDEVYLKLEEMSKNKMFSNDEGMVWSYINILTSSKRYKNIAESWTKEYENFLNYKQELFKEKITNNPPYEGMPREYVTETSWGKPTRIDKSSYPSETIDTVTYYWDYNKGNKRKVRVVYVSDGEVIKVNDFSN